MPSAGLSIRHQKCRLCFTGLLLLPFVFNGVFERNGESILWILPPYKARYIPLLKPKQQLKTHKRAGNRTVAKKTKKSWSAGDAWPCVPHHSPWWTPRANRGALWLVWFRCFLNVAFWGTFEPWDLPWIFLFWAYWTCFSTSLHLAWHQLTNFS